MGEELLGSIAIMDNLSKKDLLLVDDACINHIRNIFEDIQYTRKNLPLSLEHANRRIIALHWELTKAFLICKPIMERVNNLK